MFCFSRVTYILGGSAIRPLISFAPSLDTSYPFIVGCIWTILHHHPISFYLIVLYYVCFALVCWASTLWISLLLYFQRLVKAIVLTIAISNNGFGPPQIVSAFASSWVTHACYKMVSQSCSKTCHHKSEKKSSGIGKSATVRRRIILLQLYIVIRNHMHIFLSACCQGRVREWRDGCMPIAHMTLSPN